MDANPQIFWVTDSGKRESVHRNGVNLTQEESYLGHLERRQDGDGDWTWGYVVKGTHGWTACATFAQARKKLGDIAISMLPREDVTSCGRCPHPVHKGRCKRGMCSCV